MDQTEKLLHVEPTPLKPMAGRLLISVPFYNDPFFNRTVILLIDYDKESSVGLILNKDAGCNVNRIVPDIKLYTPLNIGGPVFHDQVFAIHNHAACEHAEQLIPGIYVGYDDIFLALAEYKAMPTLKYKFFLGYSGWAPGQLEDEISQNMWVVGNVHSKLIFDTPTDKIWEEAVKDLGPSYQHWLQVPELLSSN